MISLVECNSYSREFHQLVRELDKDLVDRYGDVQKDYEQYNDLNELNMVIIAYVDNQPAGCGAFKKYDDESAEIKRMFVKPEFRGMGLAGKILAELENCARKQAYKSTILETGVKQIEAIGLYKKHGYLQIDNYGQYIGMPASICFAKKI